MNIILIYPLRNILKNNLTALFLWLFLYKKIQNSQLNLFIFKQNISRKFSPNHVLHILICYLLNIIKSQSHIYVNNKFYNNNFMASKYRKVLTMSVQTSKQPGILLKDILQNLDASLPKYVCLKRFFSFDNLLQRQLAVLAHCFKVFVLYA